MRGLERLPGTPAAGPPDLPAAPLGSRAPLGTGAPNSGAARRRRLACQTLGDEEHDRGRLAAQDVRAEPDAQHVRPLAELPAFLRREAAFGPDQQDRPGRPPQARERLRAAGLVRHHDPRARRQRIQPSSELDRLGKRWHAQPATLLGRLDRDGLQPMGPRRPHHGALREHQIDRPDAELDRLFDQPVQAVGADRGDRQPRTDLLLGRSQAIDHPSLAAAPVEPDQLRTPLAAAGVEEPDRGALAEAQHVAQLVGALDGELDHRTRGERDVEEEARRPAEVPHRFAFPPPDARSGDMRGQASEAAVVDQQLGWVVRLPPRLRDLALLARWDRPIGTWLLLLPCWWGLALAPGPPDFRLALLFAIGAIAMRGAGCTINDLLDREFDRKVARTANRPLAAGRVGIGEALAFVAVQCLVGLLVLVQLPLPAVLVGFASVPLILVYPLMKRVTWWPQAVLGITFNWGVLVGYVAVTGRADPAMALLYLAGIAWTLGYDTIYAHQDKGDDRLVGVRSTALLFGARTLPWLLGFYAAFLVLLAAAALTAGEGLGFWLVFPLVAWSLARQLRSLDLDDPADCIRRFRMNRATGLLVTAALLAGGLGR